MKTSDVIYTIGWSPIFKYMQWFGKTLIDNSAPNRIKPTTGDLHIITYRLMGKNIPEWIYNKFPIEPEILQIFYIPAGEIGMVHKDGLQRQAAINIPLQGCADGTMHWFDDSPLLEEETINTPYTQVRLTKQEYLNKGLRLDLPICAYSTVTSPSIVNTNVWHRLDNRKNKENRWMISIRFKDNPAYQDIRSHYE